MKVSSETVMEYSLKIKLDIVGKALAFSSSGYWGSGSIDEADFLLKT
jgi:hypothetical protein